MIAVLLISLAGIFNAYMDKLRVWPDSRWLWMLGNHWFYKWGRPTVSWRNKWKLNDNAGEIILLSWKTKEFEIFKWKITLKLGPWYYAWIYKPDYVERFPYSSTLLVSFTDAWHFFQKCWILCVILAIVFYKPVFESPWWNAIHLIGIYLINFTVWYDYILDKNRKINSSRPKVPVEKEVITEEIRSIELKIDTIVNNFKDSFKKSTSPNLLETLVKSIILDKKYKGRSVLFHCSDETVNGIELIIVENGKVGYYPTGLYFKSEDRITCVDRVILLSEQVFGLDLKV